VREYLPRAEDKYLFWHQGQEAVRHLFRVASSLDSMVVGEPQILGQVRDAVRVAEELASLGPILRPLTQRTLSVAKRIRTETEIGRSRVGIGNAGVDLAMQVFGDLREKRALLVGVGEMGRQVSRALLGEGLRELLITNRTFERSVELATLHGGTAVPFDRLSDYLARVDIVITATGARQPLITPAMVRKALRSRRYRPVFLVDLAVPRNIDPSVDDIDEAFLFNIDDLQRVVQSGILERQAAAVSAMQLVDAEAEKFVRSLSEREVGPRIRHLTSVADGIRCAELQRSKKLVDSLDDHQREALDQLTRALVKKLLHRQIQTARKAAREGDTVRLDAITDSWEDL
jgi:glutamyl-tRNA reductase